VQGLFVVFLDTVFADMGGAGVAGAVDGLQLLFVNPPHIAEDVGRHILEGVLPQQLGTDINAGKQVAVDGKARHLLVSQLNADRDTLKPALMAFQPFEALSVVLADGDDLAQLLQRPLQILDPLGDDLQAVGGNILCQDDTVAVVDQTAGGRQRFHLHPVVPGQGGKVGMVDNLQLGQSQQQQQQQQYNDQAGADGPCPEQTALAQIIFQGGLVHGFS